MKKINLIKILAIGSFALVLGISSCKKPKDNTNPDNQSAAGTTVVKDSITGNVHWVAGGHYLLKGYVYVVNGATLTIDPGTIIKGDKSTKGALIVERGGKIMAVGTPANPIIFTSNQPAGSRTYGDWGGVILCGYAPVNWIASPHNDGTPGLLAAGLGQVEGGPRSLYGGGSTPNAADNSGTMQYVRLEFGGVAFSPNNEVNGLTFCGVGSGTTIDHIQVSYAGDDSYEWFGGDVNCKYLIAHRGWDDDFDTDNGYSGTVQFGMIYRDPNAADQSGSHSFESDSRNENATAPQLTKAVFCNVTTVGPLSNPAYNGYNPNFVCGEVVRRSSSLSVFNSLIIGWPLGVIVDDDGTVSTGFGSTYDNLKDGSPTLNFKNNAIIGCPAMNAAIVARKNDPHSSPNSINFGIGSQDSSTWTASPSGPYQWLRTPAYQNVYAATEGLSSRLINAFNSLNPSFVPSSTSFTVYNNTTLPSYMTTGGADPFSNGKKYPFDPTKPISTDTTNRFANYNSPGFTPGFTDPLLSGNSFITPVKYIGAFDMNNDWTQGWTNFNPLNADYGPAY
jgi:hypothetical protein